MKKNNGIPIPPKKTEKIICEYYIYIYVLYEDGKMFISFLFSRAYCSASLSS